MKLKIFALMTILFGLIYLLKPDLYHRWIWKETAITQRLLGPEKDKILMRVFGIILLLFGIILFFI
jgi:uncharacterized protein YjeT (DUF2065 family)